MAQTQTYTYSGLPLPPAADPAAFKDFGRKVEGFNPDTIDDKGMAEIIDMLYKVCSNHHSEEIVKLIDSTRSCCSQGSN